MTQHTTESELAAGLAGLSVGLEADGYRLDARWHGDRVALTVEAGPEACADCLVPRDLMADMAASMLRGAGIQVTTDDIEVSYPEGSTAH